MRILKIYSGIQT